MRDDRQRWPLFGILIVLVALFLVVLKVARLLMR